MYRYSGAFVASAPTPDYRGHRGSLASQRAVDYVAEWSTFHAAHTCTYCCGKGGVSKALIVGLTIITIQQTLAWRFLTVVQRFENARLGFAELL
jgi:hypothetical protein